MQRLLLPEILKMVVAEKVNNILTKINRRLWSSLAHVDLKECGLIEKMFLLHYRGASTTSDIVFDVQTLKYLQDIIVMPPTLSFKIS